MNKLVWCLNVLLAIFALTATLAAVRNQPGSDALLPLAGKERPETAARPVAVAAATHPRPDLTKTEVLWQSSLFRPDRAEEGDPAAGAASDTAVRVSDMELIGIGMFGTEAAAIIAFTDKDIPVVRPLRVGAGGAAEPAKKDVQHIFRRGQMVGDSGFEVKDVELDQVVLVRGEEERVLKLDRHDPASRRRLDMAARETVTRPPAPAVAMAPPASAVAVSPPAVAASGAVPPPPPGVPGGATAGGPVKGGSNIHNFNRDGRIQAALEKRRQIIESHQQGTP